jgi:succinate dehydrogenase / fumarate reductase membrane anchor subunit
MATTTEPRREAQPPDRSPQRDFRSGRERPLGGFELWTWLFMRISGLLLLVLAVGHTLIMHVQDDGVGRVNFGFVATRWGSPFWRTWDWMLLVLALIHGINGLRVITLDYVRKPGIRLTINMVFYALGFTLFVLGSVIVFTFDPSKWPGYAG